MLAGTIESFILSLNISLCCCCFNQRIGVIVLGLIEIVVVSLR